MKNSNPDTFLLFYTVFDNGILTLDSLMDSSIKCFFRVALVRRGHTTFIEPMNKEIVRKTVRCLCTTELPKKTARF